MHEGAILSGLDQRLDSLSIEEIAALLARRKSVGRRTARYLLEDDRAGVRALGERYLGRVRARERERARLRRLLDGELAFRVDGARVLAGVDESGMAPLAGPVVAAAVILPDAWVPEGLDDSKRVTPEDREALDREIRGRAVAVGLAVVSERVVDRVNVYRASRIAMRHAIDRLGRPIDLALLDGRPPRTFPVPHRAVVGGDGRVRTIAAASIVAKVARDRLLAAAHERWPEYGFVRHKGYPTPEHFAALRAHGMSPIHRRSFPRVWSEADAMGPRYRDLAERLLAAETPAELEAAEFAFDSSRAALHSSEETLLERLLETRRETVAERGPGA